MTNDVMKELRLTEQQWECLCHRLEVGDAIADALTEYHPDDVRYVAECLAAGDWDAATCHNPLIRDAVLEDAVVGSTWLVASRFDDWRPEVARLRVAETLAMRVGKYLDRRVEYPAY